ncbi:MAG: NAD(P)/FAD-dependent oxidoreductase [Candidatus Odinarchaeota archaeon]
MTSTDILIVGGGPAGVLAAITAARMDKKVILIDSKSRSQIGNKTCGDAIPLSTITYLEEELGIEKPSGGEIADHVLSLQFKTHNAELVVEGKGLILNRHEYAQRLLALAENEGVEIRSNTRAVKALHNNGVVIGARVKGKMSEEYDIDAKITIDTSGRNYVIRKSLPLEDFPLIEHDMNRDDICGAYRLIIRINEDLPDHPYKGQPLVYFRDDIPEPGYFWIFPKGDHKLNVGTGWTVTTPAKKPMKQVLHSIINEYYTPDQYSIEDAGGYTIPVRYPLANAVVNGFITAGDAAFHVTPLTAGGHGPALVAGYYAGKVAAEAVETDDVSIDKLWKYNQYIMNYLGDPHCKAMVFQESLVKIGIEGLDFILRRTLLSKDELEDLSVGKRPGVLAILYKTFKLFPRYHYLFLIFKVAKKSREISRLLEEYPAKPAEYPAWYSRYFKLMESLRRL